jgi:hypothetical protein
MKRALLVILWLAALPAWAVQPPHLDLELQLDPGQRSLTAVADLTLQAESFDLRLPPNLKPTRLNVDGRDIAPLPDLASGIRLRLAGTAPHRIELAYHGTLAPLPDLNQREVLGHLPAMLDPRGGFLPAGAGWYPDPGEPFSYRLRLHLPAGQKGVAPGTLVSESEHDGYQAEFRFDPPAEGIDLMTGPYVVSERLIPRANQPPLRLRTWFYPDLADLAPGYLDDSARYIARYSAQIGAYPFDSFSVVASPLPTGFGMPSLTYLGHDVLRLPFIRATSLGHEVLHNWWGNGVIPDWASGNWSEGLTTFMADYAYKEDQSPDAAREARLAWLRDLAAVPVAEDTPLTAFTARHHGISSVVGYDKAAMVFLMLRDAIGAEAFNRSLRRFWQQHRFQRASWADLQQAFEAETDRDLSDFFQQWVAQAGAPNLSLGPARWADGKLSLVIDQSDPPYRVWLPVRLKYTTGQTANRWLALNSAHTRLCLPNTTPVESVQLDPDYRVWRRLARDRFPPILREVFIAPRAGLLLAGDDAELSEAASALAERLLDAPAQRLHASWPGLPGDAPVLIVGRTGEVAALLGRLGLPPAPQALAGAGDAQVWAARDGAGRPYAVIATRDVAALRALQRPLPHYGRQSWLRFAAGHALDKGIWPPLPEQVRVEGAATP